mgnify:CR=1 FL=1
MNTMINNIHWMFMFKKIDRIISRTEFNLKKKEISSMGLIIGEHNSRNNVYYFIFESFTR